MEKVKKKKIIKLVVISIVALLLIKPMIGICRDINFLYINKLIPRREIKKMLKYTEERYNKKFKILKVSTGRRFLELYPIFTDGDDCLEIVAEDEDGNEFEISNSWVDESVSYSLLKYIFGPKEPKKQEKFKVEDTFDNYLYSIYKSKIEREKEDIVEKMFPGSGYIKENDIIDDTVATRKTDYIGSYSYEDYMKNNKNNIPFVATIKTGNYISRDTIEQKIKEYILESDYYLKYHIEIRFMSNDNYGSVYSAYHLSSEKDKLLYNYMWYEFSNISQMDSMYVSQINYILTRDYNKNYIIDFDRKSPRLTKDYMENTEKIDFYCHDAAGTRYSVEMDLTNSKINSIKEMGKNNN